MANAQSLDTNTHHQEPMTCRPKQETYKPLQIPISDTSSNPWAMMIMILDADSTLIAMERSWWSNNITRAAITKLVVLLF